MNPNSALEFLLQLKDVSSINGIYLDLTGSTSFNNWEHSNNLFKRVSTILSRKPCLTMNSKISSTQPITLKIILNKCQNIGLKIYLPKVNFKANQKCKKIINKTTISNFHNLMLLKDKIQRLNSLLITIKRNKKSLL